VLRYRRTLEFAANIKSTFEPVIQAHLYPRSEIDIYVQILQSDGALLQCAINATTLALIDAGVPMTDFVCSVSCALYDTTPLLDITTLEENDLPNVTVAVLPRSGKVTLVTLETQVAVERFEEMLRLTGDAGKALHIEMLASVKERTESLVTAMNMIPGAGRAEGQDVFMDSEMQDL
jgi:exosome complex component RRP41